MAPKTSLAALAAELPEFSAEHGLRGADLGEYDDDQALLPPADPHAVSAQASASAAAPASKAISPATPRLVRPS